MDSNDDAIDRTFLERLDSGELNGHSNFHMSTLSYEQLLRVAQILCTASHQVRIAAIIEVEPHPHRNAACGAPCAIRHADWIFEPKFDGIRALAVCGRRKMQPGVAARECLQIVPCPVRGDRRGRLWPSATPLSSGAQSCYDPDSI